MIKSDVNNKDTNIIIHQGHDNHQVREGDKILRVSYISYPESLLYATTFSTFNMRMDSEGMPCINMRRNDVEGYTIHNLTHHLRDTISYIIHLLPKETFEKDIFMSELSGNYIHLVDKLGFKGLTIDKTNWENPTAYMDAINIPYH